MRGIAMALVMLQHSYHLVNPDLLTPTTDFIVYFTTKIASVAFMAVSGMMISYFLFTRNDWQAVYSRFAKRAILLIVLAHPAIWLTRYFYYDAAMRSTLYGLNHEYPITDTIGLSLLIAPLIIRSTSTRFRIVLAVCVLAFTPFAVAFFMPQSPVLSMAKEAVFGQTVDRSILQVGWPLVPWLAIFLLGSFVAEGLDGVRKGRLSASTLSKHMVRTAFWLAPLGVVLTAAYKILKMQFGDSWDLDFFKAIYPGRTTSLLPIYLAVLLIVYAFLMTRIDVRGKHDRVTWFFSVFGRTSLFTYIMQFAVIHSVPSLMGLKGKLNSWQPLVLFAIGLPICWSISYAYGRLRGWIGADDYEQLSALKP
jgi:uncharacterized membrane protein